MNSELRAICFPVSKVPLSAILPNHEYNSENAFAIVGNVGIKLQPSHNIPLVDRNKVLNFCSDVYKLVENKSILEPLIPVLDQKFKGLEITVDNSKDAQFFVKVSPLLPYISKKSEIILPAISFINSYDGKIKAQAIGGLVRYVVDNKGNVLKNFATYLKGLSFIYEFKHSNTAIYSMLEVSNHIDTYIENFATVQHQIELLKSIDVENATNKNIDNIIRKMAKGTQFPLKSIDDVIDRIVYEMYLFECNFNLWILYNAMNFVLETCEAELSKKLRMEADNKIFANILELIPE